MALAQRGLAGGGTIQTASHLGSPGVDARNGHGSAYLHGRHPRDRARCAGQRGRRGAGDVHHRGAAQQEPPLLLVWNEQCRQRLQPVRAAIPRALREPAAGTASTRTSSRVRRPMLRLPGWDQGPRWWPLKRRSLSASTTSPIPTS